LNFYLDSCVVVAAFAIESATNDVLQWLEGRADDTLHISPWVLTEFSSALSMKVRMDIMPLEERALALAKWRTFHRDNLGMVLIEHGDFETAASMADQHDLGLRAGDALHVALARKANCTLVTLDQKMADAAIILGVPVAKIPS
jgi:uncharacterized protein